MTVEWKHIFGLHAGEHARNSNQFKRGYSTQPMLLNKNIIRARWFDNLTFFWTIFRARNPKDFCKFYRIKMRYLVKRDAKYSVDIVKRDVKPQRHRSDAILILISSAVLLIWWFFPHEIWWFSKMFSGKIFSLNFLN